MSTEIIVATVSLLVSLISFILTFRITTIQKNSTALLQMMEIRKSILLTEISFPIANSRSRKLSSEQIIEILGYLNLVCKLYLNSGINNNILRTFEGVIIEVFRREDIVKEYGKVYLDFKEDIKTAEPPYINLIYTRHILLKANELINRRKPFAFQRMLILMAFLRFKFIFMPNIDFWWSLSKSVATPSKKLIFDHPYDN